MNHQYDSIVAVHSAIWLIVLAFLIFYRWRHYRIDSLRQKLFILRDELFDYALEGGIDFSDPAYTATRTTLNCLIRFAHKITFSRVVIGFTSDKLQLPSRRNPHAEVMALPEGEVKQKLVSVQNRMLFALAIHITTGSPTLWIGLLIFSAHLCIKGAIKRTSDVLSAFSKIIRIDLIERMAVEIEM